MKYLFDMPKPDRSKRPFAVGLSPEVDQWAKENKHRITVEHFIGDEYPSPWCAYIGVPEMMGDVCRIVDDCGLIAYGKTKAQVAQKIYDMLKRHDQTIEEALKFLLRYIDEPEASQYAEQFGLKMTMNEPFAVLISIREFWSCKIFKEKVKKYEVRKNVPRQLNDEGYMVYVYESGRNGRHGIVGRFFSPYAVGYKNAFYPINKGRKYKGCVAEMVVAESCVAPADLIEYAGDGGLWFWKVNDPNEFSTVIPLSVVGMNRPPQSWRYLTREQVDLIEGV